MSGATENVDGSRKGWKHGKTVVDGVVRFLSVSQLEKADPTTGQGCLRKWKFDRQFGIKEPKTKAQERGDKCHLETATYERTGDRTGLSTIVMSGLHMIPPPGDDLGVELDICPDLPDGSSGLSIARLRAAGIPFTGAMDLLHTRPENYGVTDIRDAYDEPGVWKVNDWKFPANLNNAKAPHELIETMQMSGYALWCFLTAEELGIPLDRVRISHGYMPVQGTPRLSTALVTRDQVQKTWKRAEAVAVAMQDAAREPDPNKVDANTRACRAFNRDCPAKVAGVCTAVTHNSLTQLIGRTAAERLLAPQPGTTQSMTTPIQPSSLFAQLQAQAGQAASVAPTAPPIVAPVIAPAPQPTMEAELARLAAQEAATATTPPPMPMFATPAAAPAAPPAQPVTVLDYLQAIESYGFGLPAFSAAAAPAVAQAQGRLIAPGAGLSGTGELGKYMLTDINQLPAALAEVKAKATAQAAAAPAPAPTPAPEPAPVVPSGIPASHPSMMPPAITPAPAMPGLLPQDSPPSNPAFASKPPEVVTPAAEKAPRTRKKKTDETPAPAPSADAYAKLEQIREASEPVTIVTTLPTQHQDPSKFAPAPLTASPEAINFFVDTVVDGIQTTSFWPIVDYLCAEMSKDSGAVDWRAADPSGKYGYGRGKGILAALLREYKIPPGNYVFDGAMGDIGTVVVETMHAVVRRSGGLFVKGAR